MKKLCALPILLLLAILPESPAVAQFVGIPTTIAQLPTCSAGRHGRIWVVRDAVGNDDCSLGGGTDAAICLCSDGNFVAVIAASVPAADSITESMLKAVDTAADEECLTYESTVGDFEWQSCGSAGLGGTTGSTDDAILIADGTGGSTVAASAATLTAAGSLTIPSAETIEFSTDTGLARSAAGVIKVTDGSTGYGKLMVRNDGGSSLVGIAFGGTTNSQPALAANGVELWVVGAADPYSAFANLRAATLKASIYQQANDGIYGDASNLTIASGNGFLFSNGATAPGTPDVGLKRSAAGVAIISGGTSGIGALLNTVLVEANTAGSGTPNAIAATESGTVFTNEGVTAKNYEALPTAVAGYRFTFIVQDTDGMRIVANTGDDIRIGATTSTTAGYCESTTVGDSVTLVAINATSWYAVALIGSGWTCAILFPAFGVRRRLRELLFANDNTEQERRVA